MVPLSEKKDDQTPTQTVHDAESHMVEASPSEKSVDDVDHFSPALSPYAGPSFTLSSWATSGGCNDKTQTDNDSNPLTPPPPPHCTITSWSSWDDDEEEEDDDDESSSDEDDDDDTDEDADVTFITPQGKRYCHPPQHLFYITPQEWNTDSDSYDDDGDDSNKSLQCGGEEKEFDSLLVATEEEEDDDETVEFFDSSYSSSSTRVSFSQDDPQVHIVPKTPLEDMNDLFYSCHEIQKFYDERHLDVEEQEGNVDDDNNYYNNSNKTTAVGELC